MTRDEAITRHLMEKVMGWKHFTASAVDWDNLTDWWADAFGRIRSHGACPWRPLDSWQDAGAVWERAAEMGYGPIVLIFSKTDKQWCAWVDKGKIVKADSGPRAICEAIAMATGWKEGE